MNKGDFLHKHPKTSHMRVKNLDETRIINYSNIYQERVSYIKENKLTNLILINSSNGLIKVDDLDVKLLKML